MVGRQSAPAKIVFRRCERPSHSAQISFSEVKALSILIELRRAFGVFTWLYIIRLTLALWGWVSKGMKETSAENVTCVTLDLRGKLLALGR